MITLLETMARRDSNCIGSSFEDLRDIIALVTNKSRVGVCFDTCHAFAAGYDLRSPAAFQETMRTFDEIVGMQYLKALHLNDSKAPLASGRDLHANIGTGFLGLRAFHNVMNEKRFWGLPMVLETPIDVTDERGNKVKGENGKEVQDTRIWAREIKMLESFVDLEVGDEGFLALESRLAVKGEGERKRIEGQVERRNEKLEKKKAAKGRKGRKRGMAKGMAEGMAEKRRRFGARVRVNLVAWEVAVTRDYRREQEAVLVRLFCRPAMYHTPCRISKCICEHVSNVVTLSPSTAGHEASVPISVRNF